MTEPNLTVDTPRFTFDPVLFAAVAMVIFLALTLRANHKRSEATLSEWNTELTEWNTERTRLLKIINSYERVDSEKKRAEYTAPDCGADCAKGHSYMPGCIHNVEPTENAETL